MVSETFPTPFPQDQGWTPGLRHTFDDRKEKYQPWGSICIDGLPPLLYPPHLPYAPPSPPPGSVEMGSAGALMYVINDARGASGSGPMPHQTSEEMQGPFIF